jgi:sorbitol-specific phosphotransferase system component IIA
LNDPASDEAEERLVNPAIVTLAQARGDWDLNGLRYVVIAYGKFSQVVAPLPEGGHISLSLDRGTDAADVGDVLVARLQRDGVAHRFPAIAAVAGRG